MATELGDRTVSTGVDAPRTRFRWLTPAMAIVVFLLAGAALGGAGGKLSEVERNDSTAHLPEGAEATRVFAESNQFTGVEATSAVLVFTKSSAITEADRVQFILLTLRITEHLNADLAGPPMGPIVSDDGLAAEILVPFMGSDPGRIRPDVRWLREAAVMAGFEAHLTGPAGALADLTEVFGAINGMLLLVTGALVLLILILVYRGPILPLLVLAIVGTALGMANGTAYLLARAGLITISGDARSILDVLVLGAGTDYALLLTSRFREELRRTEDRFAAMRIAWRGVVAPVAASGSTVILGLLCLLASTLPATRVLGPVAALAIAFALMAMLLVLPAALVLLGRTAYWPFRPRLGSQPADRRGVWLRVAQGVGRRPRLIWVATALALAVLGVGMVRLEAHGVPRTESFLAPADSVDGQQALVAHFPAAAGTPVIVITKADRIDQVVAAAQQVPGVVEAKPFLDPLEQFDRAHAGLPPPAPKVIDGLSRIDVTQRAAADSTEATAVVRQLRRAAHAVPGADARVGGYTAANLDIQSTAQRDRLVIIPLVLAVVLLVLMLVLRAVVAPLLLVATVVLSFLATMGVSGVAFRDIFGFAGADATLPLSAFVFLVALGVDYNIFLMTRVREEVNQAGHRAGTLRGLAVTGGVITSAGVVLAATFAALAVLPLVFLAELAFAVSFGVLLDALVVRSLLVPALTVDIGRWSWWPSQLARAETGRSKPSP